MDNDNLFDEPGSILLYTKITDEQAELFTQMMARGKYEYIDLLKGILDNNLQLLELLDVMAGVKLQFPERRKVYKTLEKVFIYTYCKERNFSEESYKAMSKQYKKRIPQVRSLVETMDKFIKSDTNKGFEEEEFDIDTIDNKEIEDE